MRKLSFFILVFTVCFVFGHYEIHSQQNSNSGNSQQSQANQNIVITEPVKVSLEPNQEEINAEKGYKTRQEQRDESNAIWQQTGIVVSGFLFVLVLIQAYISHKQLNEMKLQAKAMQDGLGETRNIIKQNERAIKASQRQAKTTEAMFEVTKETFYTGQRAYIGIIGMEFEPPFVDGQPFGIKCSAINTGNTPAWDVAFNFTIVTQHPNTPADYRPPFPEITEKEIGGEILSGVKTEITGQGLTHLSHEDFMRIMAGTEHLVIYGEIHYKCIQERKEITAFQFVYDSSKHQFKKMRG